MSSPRGQDQGHQLAAPFSPQVNCGADTAPAPASGCGLWGPCGAPSRVLVGADHRAIHLMEVPVELTIGVGWRLNCRQEPTPEASLLPAGEATGHGTPRALAFGQIPPGRPRAQHPENPIDHVAMIDGWTIGLRLWWGGQRWQLLPWRMG